MLTVLVKLLALVSRSLFLSNSPKSHSAASQDVLVERFNSGVLLQNVAVESFLLLTNDVKRKTKEVENKLKFSVLANNCVVFAYRCVAVRMLLLSCFLSLFFT